MRFNLTQFLVLGLLASEPLARVIQSRNTHDRPNIYNSLTNLDSRVLAADTGVLVSRKGPGKDPGKGSGSSDKPQGLRDPKNIQNVQNKGKNFRQTLTNKIRDSAPDTGSTEPVSNKGYMVGEGNFADVAGNLKYGESVGVQFNPATWKSRVIYTTDKLHPVQQSGGNVDQRAMVAQQSFKDDDTLKTAKFTELFHDNAKEIFGAGLDKLKYIFRDSITDDVVMDSDGNYLGTKDAIDYAFEQLGTDKEDPLVLDFASTDSKEQDIIDFLSAQTHIARILSFLSDYRSEIGSKNIDKLHLFTDENESSGDEYNIIIELTG
ncbi:hypothetical protein EV127DRAFT_405403 [Xylaria flabelliformis]|nr:hypothetical protein EV127DRAFT_405403 [Xylaria flabelliformis]